jgi:hypothetical protein
MRTFEELIQLPFPEYKTKVAQQFNISEDNIDTIIDICGDDNTNHDCHIKISALIGEKKAKEYLSWMEIPDNNDISY